MRSVLTVLVLMLVPLLGGSASLAGTTARTISDSNGHVVVELSSDGIVPALSSFFVAIAPTGSYSTSYVLAASQSQGAAAPGDTVTVSAPFVTRGTRLLLVEAVVPAYPRRCFVHVYYQPATDVRDAATADPLIRSMVVNTDVFPLLPRTSSPDPWFSLSPDWVKLTLSARGVYAVTGADLSAAGVSLQQGIDPATIRVFTGGAAEQQRSLSDPDGSWRPGQAMREVAVLVEAGSDGTFDAGDRVVFYGLATDDFADYYGPAPDTLYYRHSRAKSNVYYVSWGGGFSGSPLRMGAAAAAPAAGPDRTTYFHREYRERDLVSDYGYRGDGWLWLDIPRPGKYELASVDVRDLVPSRPQVFRSVALARHVSSVDTLASNIGHHAVYLDLRGDAEQPVGDFVWNTQSTQRYYEDGLPVRVTGNFLLDGNNRFRLQVPGDLAPIGRVDRMLFAWFSVGYERRIRAVNDAIAFSAPDTSGMVNFRAAGFSNSGTLYAFDLTDPWSPIGLAGFDVAPDVGGRRVRFSAALSGGKRHFWVGGGTAFRKPSVTRFTPTDLRADVSGPNLLIICHRNFRAAADRLAAFRRAHLALYNNPSVKVVTTDEVFDNFSAGLPDAMALRNYIKFLYENAADAGGNPTLGYVCLLGDATSDFRNNASQQPDYVPSNLYISRLTAYPMMTDGWFGHMDPSDQVSGSAIIDVAVGRLPAESAQEAAVAVDKVIGYEQDSPQESWRDRVILVADDELSSQPAACDEEFTVQSEELANRHGADFLTYRKIYLTEYPQVGAVKPASRVDLLAEWNRGALVINYIGHGSSRQMADEQVFLGSDASQLNNGLRLPVLMAFSCTIGDFGDPSSKSLSEQLVLRAEGGAVCTITAASESYPDPNNKLNNALFERMTPREADGPAMPIGVALMTAKMRTAAETSFSSFQEENNLKYNIMGDPALVLRSAERPVRFQTSDSDTLIAGARTVLRGAVLKDGATDTSFNGDVEVVVREPRLRRRYTTRCINQGILLYNVAGGVLFQGTADVNNGLFEVSFRVPRLSSTGPFAFASAYAWNGSLDAVEAMDSVLVVVSPTPADSLALRQLDGAPRVALGFKSGLEVVKPGDTVRAQVHDRDGINILSTTNEGRQAILIDNLPVPIDVNEYFSFDHGGVDTSGVLLFPLPTLDPGKHRLIYKVSDSFGSTALDTLFFGVTDALDFYAHAVMNYPNPFQTSTSLLFQISNRASVSIDIFTVSGKRVRHIEEVRDGGENWIEWDGRDAAGDDVANGTYLYVATVDFTGLDRPPTVLRGKMTKIR